MYGKKDEKVHKEDKMAKITNIIAMIFGFIVAMAGVFAFHTPVTGFIDNIDDFYIRMLLTFGWFAVEFCCVIVAPILLLTSDSISIKVGGK